MLSKINNLAKLQTDSLYIPDVIIIFCLNASREKV